MLLVPLQVQPDKGNEFSFGQLFPSSAKGTTPALFLIKLLGHRGQRAEGRVQTISGNVEWSTLMRYWIELA